MSHFSVIVCIEDPSKLDDVLAPYDENLEVEPYRDYEKDDPSEFWLYSSLKRTAKDYAEGTGILPYEPDQLGWSSASSKSTPEEQRRKQGEDAALFHSLPNPIGWRDLVEVHNARYSDDETPLIYDEATDRAYTMSTRNPEGHWDYWRIGGRWGGYFTFLRDDPCLFKPERGWDSPEVIMPNTCNGGPKELLDLAGMRKAAADKAREEHAKWEAAVSGTPEALPWRSFGEQISESYSRDRAREEYRSQPRMVALQGTEYDQMWDCPIATFQKSRDAFVAIKVASAVPGYALITLDGKWMAPGRMGWFGTSSDDENDRFGYWEVSNAYIDALPDTAYLIAVDCHV